jgi:hypothetical protein
LEKKNNVVEGLFRPRTQFEGPRASFAILSLGINSYQKKIKMTKDTMGKKNTKNNHYNFLKCKKQPLKTPRQ